MAETLLVITDPLFKIARMFFDILMHGQALNDRPAHAGGCYSCLSLNYLFHRPDLPDRDMMQGRDHSCTTCLSDILQAHGIIGAEPPHRLLHEHSLSVLFSAADPGLFAFQS